MRVTPLRHTEEAIAKESGCEMSRTVRLQDRQNNEAQWSLWAKVDDKGDFVIEGQVIGRVFGDDAWEHEWERRVKRVDVPALLVLLGGKPDQDVLDVVEAHWLSIEGAGLEELITGSDVLSNLDVWDRPA